MIEPDPNDIDNLLGLNDNEVKQRIQQYGLNELPSAKARNFVEIVLDIFREPMFLLLVLCCFLYVLLGDHQEALMLSTFVIVIIAITFFQTWKTEKTLSALKDLTSPKSLVIRNGQQIYIPSRELVIDDILILNEGDKISADAILINVSNLLVDESSLTGESLAVEKYTADEKLIATKLGDEHSNVIYNGTFVIQGKAYAKVIAIGKNTELGKIGTSIQSIDTEKSLLRHEMTQIVSKILVITAILFTLIIIILSMRKDFVEALLTALTFAIAMLPEEIPAVLTIFMALGAWRISRKNVLTRRIPTIETLGSVTILCSDKTGTITQNKMKLSEVFAASEFYKLDDKTVPVQYQALIETAILASKEASFDPMEQALIEVMDTGLIANTHRDWEFVQEYSLSKELTAMTRAWKIPSRDGYAYFTKGSPEAIFSLCHLGDTETADLTSKVETIATRGLRVLGVARSKSNLNHLPESQQDIDLEFMGLVAFVDPIRDEVKEAVEDCYSAGIKVMMITGDYHVTAQSIAKEIGLRDADKYITGAELIDLSDEELVSRINQVTICSRVVPEQKLRIVNALRANNEVTIMTGDGVNDAPALKASNVGIAMGKRGTNVARESADLILIDDNFSSIVSAIRLGRRVFTNLRKAIRYIVAIHVPIAGLTLVPVIFAGLPVIFYPVHVAFLELIIDPTCSVVFESEPASRDIMKRKPRRMDEPLLSSTQLLISLAQGLVLLVSVLAIYLWMIKLGKPDSEVRMWSFATLLMGNLLLTFANKSWKSKSLGQFIFENKSIVIVLVAVFSSFALILAVPVLRRLFYF